MIRTCVRTNGGFIIIVLWYLKHAKPPVRGETCTGRLANEGWSVYLTSDIE